MLYVDSFFCVIFLYNYFMMIFIIFFFSWICCRAIVFWGLGTIIYLLLKSFFWVIRVRWVRVGISIDVFLVGFNYFRRWVELKGYRWAVKWVVCLIRIKKNFYVYFIYSVLMWIGFRKEDVMGRDFFFRNRE